MATRKLFLAGPLNIVLPNCTFNALSGALVAASRAGQNLGKFGHG